MVSPAVEKAVDTFVSAIDALDGRAHTYTAETTRIYLAAHAALIAAIEAEVEEARQQGQHSMIMECQVDV